MSLWVSDVVDMVESGGPNAPRASHTLSTTSCSRPPRLSHQGAVKAHTGTPGPGDQGVRHLWEGCGASHSRGPHGNGTSEHKPRRGGVCLGPRERETDRI